MQIANRPLNYQALALEEAETELRILVRDSFLSQQKRNITDSKAREIIDRALGKIKIPNLRIAAKQSLVNFYLRQQREINRINGANLLVLLSLIKLTDKANKTAKNIPVYRAKAIVRQAIHDYNTTHNSNYDEAKTYGVPLQKFSKDYIEENVKPVYERLAKQYPLDPEDISGRNSLRNKAEMEVRYQANQDMLSELEKQGDLIIISAHADCSERCRPFQNRVFSISGKSGVTPDGRRYSPLSEATDIFYTTKEGKTYKNGLFGFGCRHYATPYKDGFRFPKPNPKIEAKEYAITEKQRYYERQVRRWRTIAVTNKGTDNARYKEAKANATLWNEKYIKFSQDNGRAYYPSRTKLI